MPEPPGSRAGEPARRLALGVLLRVDTEGAYANLALGAALGRSKLVSRDRHFATELVYGTTRMQRALDAAIDPHLRTPVEAEVRAALRLGAYQLLCAQTPAHAAVSATVGVAPKRAKGLVNAVLRRVGEQGWPAEMTDATRLSYPDWIVERVVADWGSHDGLGALEAMNLPAAVTVRPDGYTQDLASQWVADFVGAKPGQHIADLCAAPGGKATYLGHAVGAHGMVVALDRAAARVGLIVDNIRTTRARSVRPLVADAVSPPLRSASFDHVLVDAPCSGLGVLRRRSDARWRVQRDDPEQLAALARTMLLAGASLVAPGGTLTFSVCTITETETRGVDRWAETALPGFVARPAPGAPWRAHGRGAIVLPQDAGTDGMYLLALDRP